MPDRLHQLQLENKLLRDRLLELERIQSGQITLVRHLSDFAYAEHRLEHA